MVAVIVTNFFYIYKLGTLRTILAIAVVVYHSFTIFGLKLCGGQIAVESFYMISGFYMALILNEKYVGVGSYRTFILSRFYRIFPVYWITLALALLLSLFGYFWLNHAFYLSRFISNKECLSLTTILYFIVENIIIIGQDVLYFMRIDEWCNPILTYNVLSYKHAGYQYLLVPQAWSISLELMFYCIAPFMVRKKIGWQLVIILTSIGVKLVYANYLNLNFDPWTYRFFPLELGFFMLGSIAYQFYKYIQTKNVPPQLGYILLVLCVIAVFGARETTIPIKIINLVFYSLIFCSIPFIFLAFKDNRIDRYIGELSFSIYISHHLIVSVFHHYIYAHFKLIHYYGYAVVLVSLLLAIIFQKFIVKPLELIRVKRFSLN